MNIFDYEQEFYEGLENGASRLKGIKNAINSALEKQDCKNALALYKEFIREDTFYSDSFQSIIIFPEYLALFEKHPEYYEMYNLDVMWCYKWLLSDYGDFYQVSMNQIKSIFDQYESFCKRFNYGKSTYYQSLHRFIDIHIEPKGKFKDLSAEECYKLSLKCRDDGLSNCYACNLDEEIKVALFYENDIEKALKKAKPLFSGRLSCAEVPHVTYLKFAKYYFENGDLKNSKKYIDKAFGLINRDFGMDDSLLDIKGTCIKIMAYTEPEKALKIFKKVFPMCSNTRNGFCNFEFYLGAYHLMMQLEKYAYNKIKVRFPFKTDPIYNGNAEYSVSELKDWIYNKAEFYADKFDERNGNTVFNDRLNKKYDFSNSNYKPNTTLHIPILDYIRDYIEDGILSEDFSISRNIPRNDELRFADGAMDGICLYHTNTQRQELGKLEEILAQASDGFIKKSVAKIERYFNKNDIRMLTLIDNLQRHIINNKQNLDSTNIYNLAIELAVNSNVVEAIKFGLSIFELFSDFNDDLRQIILDLALCDEFTLYCIWIVRNWEDANSIIFDIAKKVRGWGRIHAVEALKAENNEIWDWMLNYGCDNYVMPQYSAYDIFTKLELEDLLKSGITQKQLTPIGNIILYLINEGPVTGISGFENADEILMNYINSAEKLKCSDKDIENIKSIMDSYENEEIKSKCCEILGLE